MTYQQSLENIKATINFIRICDKDFIFFDFKNETEFQIIFFNMETNIEEIHKLVALKLRSNLPVIQITLESYGHEHFLYYDHNIAYQFNLTTSELIFDDSNHQFIEQSAAQIKLQVAQMLAELKKM